MFHFTSSELSTHAPGLVLPDETPEEIWVECASRERWWELARELGERGLAVVGTREELAMSRAFTREVLSGLSRSRLIIVSGLARGVDQTAHGAALEWGLPTVAIVAGGLNLADSSVVEQMKRLIVSGGGAVVSEHPPTMPALKPSFLRRNRLIAGWSKATWVVQAPARSGALNTAAWAKHFDRALLATSAQPGSSSFAGNLRLLRSGDAVAVYGPDSFGWVWLEFAAMRHKTGAQMPLSFSALPATLSAGLKQLLLLLEKYPGGAGFTDLIEEYESWGGCQAEPFFDVLSQGLSGGFLEERGPLILKNPRSCS